jgi:uncharacterized protein (TIGR04255 family)
LTGARSVLNVPHVESVRYTRNFIKTVVCELRFPTLLDLEMAPPAKLQAALRKEFPIYDKQKSVDVSVGNSVSSENAYYFRTVKGDWTVGLRSSSLSVETHAYTEFSDFYDRLDRVLNAAEKIIDTDFFTRVGLRYINVVPVVMSDGLNEWINPGLIGALSDNVFGDIEQYASELQGSTDSGKYSLRQALKYRSEGKAEYVLDYDFFQENVKLVDTLGLVSEFNKINFSLFHYCLGTKAIEFLGPPKTKTKPR